MSKKILSILLVFTMLVGTPAIMPLTANATEVTAVNADITVASVDEWMSKLSGKAIGNKTVFVTAKELDFYGKKVLPIEGFTGRFNGNGVIIKNMNITTTGETGIFHCISADVTIENMVIQSSCFKGKEWVGSVVCCIGSGSTIRNVYVGSDVTVEATVTGNRGNAGGIVGGLTGALTVTDCVFEGTVKGASDSARYMAGIVGNANVNSNVKIYNSLFTGVVDPADKSYSSGIVDGNAGTNTEVDFCIAINREGCAVTDGNIFARKLTKGEHNYSNIENVYGLDTAAASDLKGRFTARDKDIMIPNGIKNLEKLNDSFTVPNSNFYDTVKASYAITFKNWDGSVLQESPFETGSMPEYTGEAPTKPEEDFFTYEFAGWDPAVSTVNGAAIYTATFDKVLKTEAWDEVGGEYVINNVKQYLYFMETVNGGNTLSGKTVKLGSDLDLTGTGSILAPISGFAGTFDGNGKTVTGLYIKFNGANGAGMFSNVYGATIKNFALIDSYVESTGTTNDCPETGSVVACIDGTGTVIDSVYVKGTVIGFGSNVGGIAGHLGSNSKDTVISNCVFDGSATTNGLGADNVGGIVGNGNNATLTVRDCLNMGDVTGYDDYTAGIVGRHDGDGGVCSIYRCVNLGAVKGKDYVADIWAGNCTAGRQVVASDCCYIGSTPFVASATGGIFPSEDGATMIALEDVIGTSVTVVPAGWKTRDEDVIIPASVADLSPRSKHYGYAPIYLKGSGTESAPYVIASANDWLTFIELAKESTFSGEYIKLSADIDFNGVTLTPIKGFQGTFDGNGKTLSGINMYKSGTDVALFCSVGNGAVIKNFAIKSSTFKSDANWVSPVACCTEKSITIGNIYIGKDVTATAKEGYVAGILGGMYGTGATVIIDSCVFAGAINAEGDYAAGIASGICDGHTVTVSNCLNVGTINSTANYAAGIVTAEGVTVQSCVNAGKVFGSYRVGGIYAGLLKNGGVKIENCYSISAIENHNTDSGGKFTAANNSVVEINELIGNDAKAPVDFTKKAGDLAIPTGCTVVSDVLVGVVLLDGASIRFVKPSGIRFTAVLGADYLNSFKDAGKEVTFGIILTPTDYIKTAGAFTVEALKALGSDKTYVVEIPALKYQNDPAADGCYVYTGVLAPVQTHNYARAFSARAYVKVVEGDTVTYYYSDYDESVNSRSIKEVAEKAYKDTNATQTDYYRYALDVVENVEGADVNKTVYSPYTVDQRNTLLGFIGLGEQ